jgi:hypothetical protein
LVSVLSRLALESIPSRALTVFLHVSGKWVYFLKTRPRMVIQKLAVYEGTRTANDEQIAEKE